MESDSVLNQRLCDYKVESDSVSHIKLSDFLLELDSVQCYYRSDKNWLTIICFGNISGSTCYTKIKIACHESWSFWLSYEVLKIQVFMIAKRASIRYFFTLCVGFSFYCTFQL